MALNPLFIIAAGAGVFLIYETSKASQAMENKKASPKDKKIPLASPHFSDMRENPFQQQQKILVENIQPTQAGQLNNPRMAGRWMLTLPGGTLVPMQCSFNQLKRKVTILIKDPPKKTPKGMNHLHDDRYGLESEEALEMFIQ